MKQLDLKIDQRVSHLGGNRILPDWDHVVATLHSAAFRLRICHFAIMALC
jgi:hypothetical protein